MSAKFDDKTVASNGSGKSKVRATTADILRGMSKWKQQARVVAKQVQRRVEKDSDEYRERELESRRELIHRSGALWCSLLDSEIARSRV